MISTLQPSRRNGLMQTRQVEGEGILRMLLLALAMAMPLATMVYLQVQKTRMGYEMSEIRAQIKKQEEIQRQLLLQRSQYQRDEAVQAFAHQSGLQPRKQGYLIPKAYTVNDQHLAKLHPGSAPTGL
jgi:cell division protein FtsL